MPRWPQHKATLSETAPFLRILLPLAAGITVFYLLQAYSIPLADITVAGSISFLLFVISAVSRRSSPLGIWLRFLSVNMVLACIAWILCYYNDIRNDTSWFGHNNAEAIACKVRVKEITEKEKTWKLRVSVLNNIGHDAATTTRGDAFVYVYKDKGPLNCAKGDTLLIPNKWIPITNAGNPFEFDYADYCARNNLYYRQFISAGDIDLYAKGNDKDQTFTERTHDWCMAQLARHIPDTATKGLIQAMLLGDEVNLDEHLRSAYAATGIVHIIAISGGNVSIFFFAISGLLWWLRHKKYKWIKYVAALPLVWFYVVMAGAPPSAIRAALMFSLLAAGYAFGKNGNTLNQLFATAAVLLCAAPMWLFSIGFQLSFIAVLSLVLFYPLIYKLAKPASRISKALWSAVCASAAAEILVAPLVIYYFHLFPVFFIVANVAAFLFMGIVLVAGMLIIAFSTVPAIASLIAAITIWIVQLFNGIVYCLQGLNPTAFSFLALKPVELALVYIIIAALAYYIIKQKKQGLFVALAISCMLLCLLCRDEWQALKQERFVVYNTNRDSREELIRGKYHAVLHAGNIAADKEDYILKPVYACWGCRRQMPVQDSEIINCGGKTILLLNAPIRSKSAFHVDYVVINYPISQFEPAVIQQQFSPRMIITGNTGSLRQMSDCAAQCQKYHIPVHITTLDGAFVPDTF